MSFWSNPFKSALKIAKWTAPPIPVINPSNGSPGLYVPGKDNGYYAFGSGGHNAHISPIYANGGGNARYNAPSFAGYSGRGVNNLSHLWGGRMLENR